MSNPEARRKGRPRLSNFITKVTPDDIPLFVSLISTAVPHLAKSRRLREEPWDSVFRAISVRDFTQEEYERLMEETFIFLSGQGLDPANSFHQQIITHWIHTSYDLWRDGPIPTFDDLKRKYEQK